LGQALDDEEIQLGVSIAHLTFSLTPANARRESGQPRCLQIPLFLLLPKQRFWKYGMFFDSRDGNPPRNSLKVDGSSASIAVGFLR